MLNYIKDNYSWIFPVASAIWVVWWKYRTHKRNIKQDEFNSKIWEKELKSQVVFERIDRTSFYVLYQIKNIGGSVAENVEIEFDNNIFTINKDYSAKFPIKRLIPNNEPYLLKVDTKCGAVKETVKYKWIDKYYGEQKGEFEITTIGY